MFPDGEVMDTEDIGDFHYWRAHDLSGEGRSKEALAHLQTAIEEYPPNAAVFILAGDIHLFDHEQLGVNYETADRIALDYYSRALAVEPKDAEAWAGKSLALLYLDRPEEALAAAETGLFMLPMAVGHGMIVPDLHNNIAEALFDHKVGALLDLDRKEEARQALSDGLKYCPGSEYLTRLCREFSPFGSPDARGPG